MQAVYEAEGRTFNIADIPDFENAYLAENRLSSMNAAQVHEWVTLYMKPLLEEVANLTQGSRAAYDELTDYMMAKHGLERNEVTARRDAQRQTEEEYAEKRKAIEKKLEADPQDQGALAEQEMLEQEMDAREEELYERNRKKDYAGLTALTGKAKVAEAEQEAHDMVQDYESSHNVTALWGAVNAATRSSLEKVYASGFLSREKYQEIAGMYDYYIPLQGFAETVAEDEYAYLGSDGSAGYGTPIRTARGRKSKADDPIATISMNGEAYNVVPHLFIWG